MFCPNCGKEIDEDSKYCSECGERINIKNEEIEPEIIDSDNEYSKEDIENNKVLSLFSYISFLFIIPLIACPKSKYAKFHINQGIVLCLSNVILEAILKLLKLLDITFAIEVVDGVISIGLTILMIIGIINAVSGNAKKLPVIGHIRILK